ncbi:MAG: hypothetical protein ACP5DC_02830 [Halothiobacillaceae bacterium]
MTEKTYFQPGDYESPLTAEGRARTIAALQICAGSQTLAKDVPMRRDMLRKLTSPRAVSYWLEKGWLQKAGKAGKVELLALTAKGVATCNNSLAGGSEVPTRQELVDRCRDQMLNGAPGFMEVTFAAIEAHGDESSA